MKIESSKKLSAVRKVPETYLFQALGSFGTLGPKLSHGTSWIAEIIHWIISPNIRTHLRKVFFRGLYLPSEQALKKPVFSDETGRIGKLNRQTFYR